ncbi:MAG: oligosaccharide flippase family protein [Crocinitomicaceae bacterium]|nr:oligosaccharide flippase family protein [Crocinitomicaceae bacterium]
MTKIKGFIGETLIYGFANVFSRVFALVLIPFYMEFLGRTGYSNIVMILGLFSVLSFVLALNAGVFFYYYEWETKKFQKMIFTSWFYYQVVCALVIVASLFFFADFIKDIFIVTAENEEEVTKAISLSGLLFIPYLFNITNINYFRIDRKAKSVIVIVFLEALFTMAIVVLGLKFYDFGLVEVVLGQVIARAIVAVLYLKTARNYTHWKNVSLKILKRLLGFSWPYFVISAFAWAQLTIDKFIGVRYLENKDDIALLALAMQLAIPITVLADMIRMAIAPFIMSIKKDKNAEQTYQHVFDLSVFSGLIVLIAIVIGTPILLELIGNTEYLEVIKVVPLIAFASVLSLVVNQFSISFSLKKKNPYILIATITGGVFVILTNILFMRDYGYIVSGFSQVIASLLMVLILYIMGRKIADLSIRIGNSVLFILITGLFIGSVYVDIDSILNGNYFTLFFSGAICLMLLALAYLLTYKKSKLD